MNNRILLDTHVLVWLLADSKRIGGRSADLIRKTLSGGKLYISAVSMWETAMLVERGRIKLLKPIGYWYREVLSFGIQEIPLCGNIALESVLLHGIHADPADRMIIATAIYKGLRLLTGDGKILEWPGPLERLNVHE